MNKDPTQTCNGVIFFICLGGRKAKGSMVSNIMRTIMKKNWREKNYNPSGLRTKKKHESRSVGE